MGIDERLAAIARSAELMQGSQRDFERVVRQGFETLTALHADTQHDLQRMERAIERLAHVAAGHEERLNKLED
jgi:hypothetical protein